MGNAHFSNVKSESEHGMTLGCHCTSTYRVRKICMAFFRTQRGLRPLTQHYVQPNLYVHLLCSRKRSAAPFSNVKLKMHGILPNVMRET